MRRCSICDEKKDCTREMAKGYRKYCSERHGELKKRYKCEIVGGLCRLDNCDRYTECNKTAKKNYKAWKRAYYRDKKKELERLSKGGM